MKYYGIYRGTAMNTLDPTDKGRVQVMIPAVAAATGWAAPCRDYSHTATTPPIGTKVWVMFENGDPSRPVWMGCMD